MPQQDGRTELRRVALQVNTNEGSELYQFQVNPQSYKETRPQRTTVFKTRQANIVEDFGSDLMTIEFSGTTGFRSAPMTTRNGVRNLNGAQRLFRLRDLIKRYADSGGTTEPDADPNTFEMVFYNYTDDNKSYIVHLAPEGFVVDRSVEQPLLYQYTINLIVIREAGKADIRDKDLVSVGNPINNGNNPNAHHRDYIGATEGIGDALGVQDTGASGGSGTSSSDSPNSSSGTGRAGGYRSGIGSQQFRVPEGVKNWSGNTYGSSRNTYSTGGGGTTSRRGGRNAGGSTGGGAR